MCSKPRRSVPLTRCGATNEVPPARLGSILNSPGKTSGREASICACSLRRTISLEDDALSLFDLEVGALDVVGEVGLPERKVAPIRHTIIPCQRCHANQLGEQRIEERQSRAIKGVAGGRRASGGGTDRARSRA